jgi:hypothetical protein
MQQRPARSAAPGSSARHRYRRDQWWWPSGSHLPVSGGGVPQRGERTGASDIGCQLSAQITRSGCEAVGDHGRGRGCPSVARVDAVLRGGCPGDRVGACARAGRCAYPHWYSLLTGWMAQKRDGLVARNPLLRRNLILRNWAQMFSPRDLCPVVFRITLFV